MNLRRTASATVASALVALSFTVIDAAAAHATPTAGANIQITEVAYGGKAGSGPDGEYVELTNVGNASQDMSGWAFVDSNHASSAAADLSGLGTIAPGESAIITDLSPDAFRTEWGLASTVPVVGDGSQSLNSSANTLDIYDSADTSGTPVESLSYDSAWWGGKGTSIAVDAADLDQTSTTEAAPNGWSLTTLSDHYSWTSVSGAVGSPGASPLGLDTQADVHTATGTTILTIAGVADQTAGTGVAFTSTTPTASGGTGPYTWTETGLPSWASLDSTTGVITGTPSAAGSASVTLTATDSLGDSGSVTFTLTTASIDPNWSNIVINEVTSDNSDDTELTSHLPAALLTALQGTSNGPSDLIELYNKGDAAVDIAGWLQADSHAADTATDFSGRVFDVDGNPITSIPAHGYGVFSSGQGLGSGGDAVKIYLPDGTLVDSVTFGAGQAGYDESLDPEDNGPEPSTEVYHALARCPADGAGDVNTNADDATTSWYSVKVASFGSSNDASCQTDSDPAAAVKYFNEQPPTGLPSTCAPSAPSGSDTITVPDAVAWPTSDGVGTVDDQCEFITPEDPTGNDMSSLVFSADGSVLWGAQNKSHLWKLVKDPATGKFLPATDDDWGNGKAITFAGTDPDASQPDDEGLTVGGNGDLFATSERDNQNSKVSKDEVLEYDPTQSGTTLAPVQQWDLTSDFVPSSLAATGDDSNLGFEGVTYVPDSFLTSHGFHDQNLDKTYDPSDYPDHGDGLFFLGLEKTGHVYAYALESNGDYQRIADIDTGIDGTSAIADLQFNADDQGIWTACDNDCGVVDSLLRIDAAGNFVRVVSYDRPAGLPDDNLEGFAIAPASTATDGKREVVWSDDGIYGEGNAWNADKTANVPSADWGHALYAGTIPVDAAPSALGGTVRATGTVGAAYTSPALTPMGGFPAVYDFSISAGSLPAGLTLNAQTGAITGMPSAAGASTFTIAASNGVGVPATLQATITVAADGGSQGDSPGTGPAATIAPGTPAVTSGRSVSFTFDSSDPTVTYQCKVEPGGDFAPCQSGVTETVTADGTYTFEVEAVDADGVAGPVASQTFTVDTTAPKATVTGVRRNATYAGIGPMPTCKATDATSGVASCSLSVKRTTTKVSVTVRATDKAGNVSTTTVTYKTLPVSLGGKSPRRAPYKAKAYRLVVLTTTGRAPRYLAPAAHGAPKGRGTALRPTAVVDGIHEWRLTIHPKVRGKGVHTAEVVVGSKRTKLRFKR